MKKLLSISVLAFVAFGVGAKFYDTFAPAVDTQLKAIQPVEMCHNYTKNQVTGEFEIKSSYPCEAN